MATVREMALGWVTAMLLMAERLATRSRWDSFAPGP
jgi:hypothetical protein